MKKVSQIMREFQVKFPLLGGREEPSISLNPEQREAKLKLTFHRLWDLDKIILTNIGSAKTFKNGALHLSPCRLKSTMNSK